MKIHRASSDDCMHSIAKRYGFFWETLWNLAENKELKDLRKNPNCLRQGDQVRIAELRCKEESGATEQRHRYKRKGVPIRFEIQFLEEGSPERYAGKRWVLQLEGNLLEGTLDEKGWLKLAVPPEVHQGKLRVGEGEEEEFFDLQLGELDPIDTPRGAQQRLRNLGLFGGEPSDEWNEEAVDALMDFQGERVVGDDKEPSGEYDDDTRAALEEAFGE